ncbi:MAG: FAD-dependent 5-carboxymethylaminomethyl-2-thiouridine(34) oxidoreductase MnmC [Ideonella sp.]
MHELSARWAERDRFVVLETAFGVGSRFLAIWAAWRADPRRCRSLHFIAIEAQPPDADALRRTEHDSETQALAIELIAAWPALTPNLHSLDFDDGRVHLLLIVNDLRNGLRELVAEVDAFWLDRAMIGAPGEVWQPRLCKRLARLAAPNATLSSVSADPELVAGLRSAGFEMTVQPNSTLGKFAPRFGPSRPPARRTAAASSSRDAVIIGAGLAGCATAAALAAQGWTVTLIDRHPEPATEASGNSAGVFHGVVHAHDGHHARFNRAAALQASRTFGRMLEGARPKDAQSQAALGSVDGSVDGLVVGSVDGLVRLGSRLADLASMTELLLERRLPPGFVQALDAAQASRLAGVALADAAWFYPTAGWMRPRWLARSWLDEAARACTFVGGVEVQTLRNIDDRWVLLDRHDAPIANAANLVLANAGGAQRLLAGLATAPIDWPLQSVRGQSSRIALDACLRAPKLPLSGAGYVLPTVDGSLVFGATAQADDADPAVRNSDHLENAVRLAQLSRDFGSVQHLPPGAFEGRTAWRCVAADRLPLIGAVPDAWAGGSNEGAWDQPRFVPRRSGLFMFTALGSRGITWSPLGAQVLASMMTGAPIPLEASLLDAIDPARFLSRANRRKAAVDSADAG